MASGTAVSLMKSASNATWVAAVKCVLAQTNSASLGCGQKLLLVAGGQQQRRSEFEKEFAGRIEFDAARIVAGDIAGGRGRSLH